MRKLDLTGQRFERLSVIAEGRRGYWLCRCECGEEKEIATNHLRSGATRSCGCLLKVKGNRRHGLFGTTIHSTWEKMKQRCYDPENSAYPDYGGRGIIVCDRWRWGEDGKHPLTCFYEDMGDRPANPEGWSSKKPYYTLDRKDNNGNYEPSNCRWATPTEQRLNQRQR